MRLLGGRASARPAVDLVAGPTTGGVILAFETARQLGTRSIFAEEVRDADGGTHREFRRGFTIEPGERVLLVDDILTTGGSLLAMIPAVEALGGEIVACVVMVDRSGGRATLTSPTTGRTYPLRALWQLDLPTYEPGPETCPRCAAGDPLYAPGSTGTGADRPPPDAVDRGTRRLFVVALVVARRRSSGLATVAPAAAPARPTAGRPARRAVDRASSSGSTRQGLGDVRGVHAATRRWRRSVDVRARPRSRTGRVPARATSPSTRRPREPVRVCYRDDGGDACAIRLEDAGVTRPRPSSRRPAIAASSSSSLTMSMNEPCTMPSPSTTKTHGSDGSRHSSVAGAGVSWPSVRTGWSWPSTSSSWYGSTLMKVRSGLAAAIGLSRSRVGPHWAVAQNFGVAKTSDERLPGGERRRRPRSRRTPRRLVVGRDRG